VNGFIVRFVGGQIGGETQFQRGYPEQSREIRVPVWSRIQGIGTYSEWATIPAPSTWEEDIYRWDGEVRGGEYIYRWVRPDTAGFQKTIREQKRRITELERAKEVLDGLNALRIYLNNGF
jgi:hypothetical protein